MASLCVLLLVGALQLSAAAVYTEIVQEDLAHPGQCRDSQDGSFHQRGHRWQHQGVCEQRGCGAGSRPGTMTIDHIGCGMVMAEPPCRVIPEDNSKPWPSCCSSIWCPSDKDENQTTLK